MKQKAHTSAPFILPTDASKTWSKRKRPKIKHNMLAFEVFVIRNIKLGLGFGGFLHEFQQLSNLLVSKGVKLLLWEVGSKVRPAGCVWHVVACLLPEHRCIVLRGGGEQMLVIKKQTQAMFSLYISKSM